MTENIASLADVSKSYGNQIVIRNLNLKVRQQAFTALLGPSGCGKSTTLRLLAGFEEPDSGTVSLEGKPVSGVTFVPPEQRNIGMVFQDLALFPHLSVVNNIAFGIKAPRRVKKRRTNELLKLVGLEGLGHKMPHELSGGQQQRVAVARALAPKPGLILMDEPFSSLDDQLRHQLRKDLQRIFREEKVTVVMVTHDCREAFSFADHVVLMNEGQVIQEGTSSEIYSRPSTPWVAGFVGSANMIEAEIKNGCIHSELGSFEQQDCCEPGACVKMFRPENVTVRRSINGDSDGLIHAVDFIGDCEVLTIRLKSGTLMQARVDTGQNWSLADPVTLELNQFQLYPQDTGQC